jgi:hypothetical protein
VGRFLLGEVMADDNSNWYAKLAKSGWLGTKAQVSAQYGKPAWGADNSSDDSTSEDPKAQALKKMMNKTPSSDGSAT